MDSWDSLEVKRRGVKCKGNVPVETPGDTLTDYGRTQSKGTWGEKLWGEGPPPGMFLSIAPSAFTKVQPIQSSDCSILSLVVVQLPRLCFQGPNPLS